MIRGTGNSKKKRQKYATEENKVQYYVKNERDTSIDHTTLFCRAMPLNEARYAGRQLLRVGCYGRIAYYLFDKAAKSQA